MSRPVQAGSDCSEVNRGRTDLLLVDDYSDLSMSVQF